MSAIRILIATPCTGETVTTEYLRTVVKIGAEAKRLNPSFDFDLLTISMADIYKARNYLAAQFIRHARFTHLLFVDSDMGFEPRLIEKMLRYDKPFTAAFYPFRKIDMARFHETSRKVDESGLAERLALDFVSAASIVGERRAEGGVAYRVDEGFVRTKEIGTGVMLLKREVFEKLRDAYPDLMGPPNQSPYDQLGVSEPVHQCFTSLRTDDGRYLSEDISFCWRWDRCGGQIWACVDEEITHFGQKAYKGAYIDRLKHGMFQT